MRKHIFFKTLPLISLSRAKNDTFLFLQQSIRQYSFNNEENNDEWYNKPAVRVD